MGDCLSETILITTFGPVIIGAASFWYSITWWEESLLMSDNSALNLRWHTQGWDNNQSLSSLSCKLSTGLTRGDRTKNPQDGFRVLGVHWMEIWVLSFQCNLNSDMIQIQIQILSNIGSNQLYYILNEVILTFSLPTKREVLCWKRDSKILYAPSKTKLNSRVRKIKLKFVSVELWLQDSILATPVLINHWN